MIGVTAAARELSLYEYSQLGSKQQNQQTSSERELENVYVSKRQLAERDEELAILQKAAKPKRLNVCLY